MLDLGAYLERIGWGGATSPGLSTLAGLLRAHMQSIPFENLDVLLKRPISIGLDKVAAKLIAARRGGYCFEHVTLFAAALERLGFEIARHSARVVLYAHRAHSPRAHMFLTVTLPEGRFVADPGFGGPAAAFPVPLVEDTPARNALTHWVNRDGAFWVLHTRRDGGNPADAWVSTLEHDNAMDFEMANHFTATHPQSPFAGRLMMSKFTSEGRVTLMNRDFTIRDGGHSTHGQLESRGDLRAFAREHMGFDLPDIESLRCPGIPEWD